MKHSERNLLRDGKCPVASLTEVSACLTSDLADVDGRHLRGADGRVTRRVGQRLARPDGQLLLLPGGHDLLGD